MEGMKTYRILAWIGLVVGTIAVLSLMCSIMTAHAGVAQMIEALINVAVILAALWILNHTR